MSKWTLKLYFCFFVFYPPGNYFVSVIIYNTRHITGGIYSGLSYALYTNDCTTADPSVKLLNFADETTAGLIQDNDAACSVIVTTLTHGWCVSVVRATWSLTRSRLQR